jgi:hypothetical protein
VLFNNTPTALLPDTPEEEAIGAYLRGAWVVFAKDPLNGLVSYGWPRYSTSESTLVRLAYNNQTGPNLAIGNEYDTKCLGVPVVVSPNTTSATPTPSTTSSATASPTVAGNVGDRSTPRMNAVLGLVVLLVCLLR